MKKILTAIGLLAATSAQAGLFDSMMTADFQQMKPLAKYKLEVYGYDARVYEFAPKHAPGTVCVLVATGGDSNSVLLECEPRGK